MSEQSQDDLLTTEEIELLQKIQNKLENIYKDAPQKKDFSDALNFEDKEFYEHPEPITNSPREIIFLLKGIARELNSDGSPSDTIEIMEHNYHIPVSPNHSYKEYMTKFLEKFRSKLEDTCKELHNE